MATNIIITEKMTFGGNCIGKIEGKTVFVPYAIPGEKIEVEIVESKKDYDNACIVKIIEPSVHRVEPKCALYGKCGGCNMMHIDSEYQVELRRQMLEDVFLRNGISIPEVKVVAGSPFGYRNRFQLHDGGLEGKGSNEIIPIDVCPVAVPEINSYLTSTPMERRPKGRCHIFAGKNVSPEFIIAEPEPEIQVDRRSYKELTSKEKKKRGKHFIRPKFEGIAENPETRAEAVIGGKKIAFNVQGFFQSNLEVLEKAVMEICRNISGKRVLDMYSGAGTFSAFLSDRYEKVTMVEHNRGAMVFAEENLSGKKHESYGISGAQWVKDNAPGIIRSEGNFDAIVIDPPRSGMENEVCDWICRSGVPVVRSLSCNPSTLARDTGKMLKAGYSIESIYMLDFYPQTAHIECLVNCVSDRAL